MCGIGHAGNAVAGNVDVLAGGLKRGRIKSAFVGGEVEIPTTVQCAALDAAAARIGKAVQTEMALSGLDDEVSTSVHLRAGTGH